jgi:hypothetical protein
VLDFVKPQPPEGSVSALVGRHGSMKSAGRVRVRNMPSYLPSWGPTGPSWKLGARRAPRNHRSWNSVTVKEMFGFLLLVVNFAAMASASWPAV